MFFFPFCLCVDQECWADPCFVSGIGKQKLWRCLWMLLKRDSLGKDAQFALSWSGAEPVSESAVGCWYGDQSLWPCANFLWETPMLSGSVTVTEVGSCELLKLLVNSIVTIACTKQGSGAARHVLEAVESRRIINFSHGVWLSMWSFGQENAWSSAVSNTSPRGCHNCTLDTESQMFTKSSSHTLVSKNYTEMGSVRLTSWMASSDSRHPVYKFSPYIFLQFKLQCLINWFDWRECTKQSSNGKNKQLDTCSLSQSC